MKLRITQARWQVVLTSIALIAISIACSASKSAESPSANAASASTNQPLTPPGSSITQDKQPCTLTLSAAPNVNGMRLGMTPEEVLALFPGSKQDPELQPNLTRPPNQYGTRNVLIKPSKYESRAQFTDITQITFTFLDERLYRMHIGFNGPKWAQVDQFVAKVVDGTNLPAAEHWSPYAGMEDQMRTLTCTGFEVRVFAGGEGGNLNYVLLQDVEADLKLKERRQKALQQTSQTPGNQ